MSLSTSTTRAPRPDRWLSPHQPLDPMIRRMTYGKIRPMEDDGPFAFLHRWLRRV